METRGSGRQRSSTYQPQQSADNDGNESVDSLEACLQARNDESDDRETFEQMEKALRGFEEALQPSPIIDRQSPSSDGSLMSDGGKFMDMRSKPNQVSSRSAAGDDKQTGDDADRLARAKAYALCMGIDVEDALSSSSLHDYLSRDEDEDFVANHDVERRRSRKERQEADWQTHASENREVEREITVPYDEMDNSTSTGRSSYYSDSEDDEFNEVNVLGELWGLFEEQRKIWLGNVRDEIRNRRNRRRRVRKKKIRRKRYSYARRDGRNAREDATMEGTVTSGCTREDATLEGTVTSGYTREDTTHEGTVTSGCTRGDATHEGTVISGYTREEDTTVADTFLSGSTRGETTMSGSTEYEKPVPVQPSLLLEPKYLAEEDDDRGENESLSNKAFSMIHNVCSGPWFRCQSPQSEGEGATVMKTNTNAKDSDVMAMSVKERLDLLVQGLNLDSDVAAANVAKQSGYSNESTESSPLVRTPTQSELKAIYESRVTEGKKPPPLTKDKSFSRTALSFRRQATSNLDSPRTEADDDTVEMSNQRHRNGLNKVVSTKTAAVAAEQKKKSFRHKLFLSRSKKKGLLKDAAQSTSKDTSSMPVSPARTAATGISDTTSLESQSRDEDDDVCASYAALAITRTNSKVLISI